MILKILTSRWFLMAALAAALFFGAAAGAKMHSKNRELSNKLDQLMENYERTQQALSEREGAMRDLSERLSEKKRVIYVARDDCADAVMADDIRNSFVRFSTAE